MCRRERERDFATKRSAWPGAVSPPLLMPTQMLRHRELQEQQPASSPKATPFCKILMVSSDFYTALQAVLNYLSVETPVRTTVEGKLFVSRVTLRRRGLWHGISSMVFAHHLQH